MTSLTLSTMTSGKLSPQTTETHRTPRGHAVRLRRLLVTAALVGAIGIPATVGSVDSAQAISGPSCGYISCTVYFSRAETRYIAYGGAAASAYLARIPRIGPALAALGSFLPQWANWATRNGWCLAVKRVHVTGSVVPWAYRC